MNVLVTGATGFIGSHLCSALKDAGHTVTALSRNGARAEKALPALSGAQSWDSLAGPPPTSAFQGIDAVVHLAGESVAGRWTRSKRRAIRDSRLLGTRNLVEGMLASDPSPGVMVSASAIGYYGDRGDEELVEESAPGDDFLAEVCKGWEHETRRAEDAGVTVTRLRTGIVLGNGSGALQQMLTPAKLGLGGPLGSGGQWWSWIHLDDMVGVVQHALARESSTVLNTTAPEPARQRDFAKAMGSVLRRPAFLPAPAFALKLMLGGFSTELLGSKRVLPKHLQEAGYEFRFPTLAGALQDLLGA